MVTVTNLNGQVVLTQKSINKNQVNLDLNSLQKGVYFAVVKSENGLVATKKIVKL